MKKIRSNFEQKRLSLQKVLDSQKVASSRNQMGQFATQTELAFDILSYAMMYFEGNEKVRFIDPATGTGAFYSALLDTFARNRIDSTVGYEIDPHYGEPARELWNHTGLTIHLEDFTRVETPLSHEKFNLLICNPPYVRHHHLSSVEKQRLKTCTRNACGMEISGLAGLYCYFLGLSHAWMSDNALAGWLIPSEFMDVNYGASVKRYLLDKVTLLHIHRFDPNDVQFDDALVSSAVLWFRNTPPPTGSTVRFTFGGTLEKPSLERWVSIEDLRYESKWTRYPIKENRKPERGLLLGDFF